MEKSKSGRPDVAGRSKHGHTIVVPSGIVDVSRVTGNNFGYGVPLWYGPYPPISYPFSTNRTLEVRNVPFSTIKPVFYGTVRTITVRNTRVRLQYGYGTEKDFVPLGYVRTAHYEHCLDTYRYDFTNRYKHLFKIPPMSECRYLFVHVISTNIGIHVDNYRYIIRYIYRYIKVSLKVHLIGNYWHAHRCIQRYLKIPRYVQPILNYLYLCAYLCRYL